MEATILDDRLKDMLEEVLVKMIQERKEVFYEIFIEALEDVALANAIKEGRRNRFVSEERIMATLEK